VQLIDKSFIRSPKSYIIQSLLAVAVLAIILYFVEVLTHAAVVAALGASTEVNRWPYCRSALRFHMSLRLSYRPSKPNDC